MQDCRAISLPTDGPEASIIRPIKLQHGKSGATDGVRSHDINLGKVALYQLSYCRIKRIQEGRNNGHVKGFNSPIFHPNDTHR